MVRPGQRDQPARARQRRGVGPVTVTRLVRQRGERRHRRQIAQHTTVALREARMRAEQR